MDPRTTTPRALVTKRRKTVEALYLQGVRIDQIVAECEKQFRDIKRRNIENDIFIIRSAWREQAIEFFGDVGHWWIQTALHDRRAAIKAGDLRLAYNIAKDIAKLAGVRIVDMTIATDSDSGDNAKTWMELMMEERARKNLPPSDYVVVEGEVTAVEPAEDQGSS